MLSLETLGASPDAPGSQTYPAPFGRVFPDRGNFVAFVGTIVAAIPRPGRSRPFAGTAMFPRWGHRAGARPGVDWSDHKSLAERGIPAVMITDTALYRYAHYHTPADTPDKVDYATLARLTRALRTSCATCGRCGVECGPAAREPLDATRSRLRHSGGAGKVIGSLLQARTAR